MTNRSSLVMLPVRPRSMVIVVIGVRPRLLLCLFENHPRDAKRHTMHKLLALFADVCAPVVLGLKLINVCDAASIVRRRTNPRAGKQHWTGRHGCGQDIDRGAGAR